MIGIASRASDLFRNTQAILRPLNELLVEVGVLALQFDRFSCDEKLLYLCRVFQGIAVREHDVGDLSLRYAPGLSIDSKNLRRIDSDRFPRFLFRQSEGNGHRRVPWQISRTGCAIARECDLDAGFDEFGGSRVVHIIRIGVVTGRLERSAENDRHVSAFQQIYNLPCLSTSTQNTPQFEFVNEIEGPFDFVFTFDVEQRGLLPIDYRN